MAIFSNLLAKLFPKKELLSPLPGQNTQKSKLISPLPDGASTAYVPRPAMAMAATPTPTPTTTPTNTYRNTNVDKYWKKQNPQRYSEMIAGITAASKASGVPSGLLGDIAALESEFGNRAKTTVPGQTAAGPYMFTKPTIQEAINRGWATSSFNPQSATESASLAAKYIKNKLLNRWDVVKNPGAGKQSLKDYYSPDELNKYLLNQFKLQ